MGLTEEIFVAALEGKGFLPLKRKSKRFKTWFAILDLKTCFNCREKHGKILPIKEKLEQNPPLHPNCRCMVPIMEAFDAGTATKDGANGADWWLKYKGMLPNYYVTRSEAKAAGWKPSKGNLHDVLPGKMLMGGKFSNKDGHLPEKEGRNWYEADKSGYRNDCRIVFSDDGLIFATYDHYLTYYEIV